MRQQRLEIPMRKTRDRRMECYRQKMVENWSMGLEGFCLELMSQKLRMPKNDILLLCASVRNELGQGKVSGRWERYVFPKATLVLMTNILNLT